MILYFKHIIHIDDFPLNGHPPSNKLHEGERSEDRRSTKPENVEIENSNASKGRRRNIYNDTSARKYGFIVTKIKTIIIMYLQ